MMVGVNFGAKNFLMRSIMADVIDQDRVTVGAERSALFYSLLTLTAKLGGCTCHWHRIPDIGLGRF